MPVESKETFRTFIAIEVPAHIRRAIKVHIDQLRSVFPEMRASWSREDNLHLTLKFLGDVPVKRITSLSEALAGAALTIQPFELKVSDCGMFPPHGKPKVLWIGCADAPSSSPSTEARDVGISSASAEFSSSVARPFSSPPILSLYQAIEDACAAAGFAREARTYHPHLTIARLREAKGARALAEHHTRIGFAPQTFLVSDVVLFRSKLSSKGSEHTALSRHGLGNRGE